MPQHSKLQRRKRSLASVVAGVAAGGLLLGGGTLATWSDSETAAGAAAVSSGNLALEALGAGAWQDVSAAAPVAVPDVEAYRIVPGDTLQKTQDLDLALYGDNIRGTLAVELPEGGPTGELFSSEHVTASYKILDKRSGQAYVEETPANSPAGPYNLSQSEFTNALDGEADLAYQVKVQFSKDTPQRVLTQAAGALKTARVVLKQTRVPLSGELSIAAAPVTQEAGPGATVPVKFTVVNRGALPLNNLSIAAPGVVFEDSTLERLAIGQTAVFEGVYKLTASQITGAPVTVPATVTATPQGETVPVLSEAAALIPTLTPAPAVTPTVSSTLSTDGGAPGKLDAGDVVSFSATVKNSGNVALENVSLSSTPAVSWSGVKAILPGESASFSGSYSASEAAVTGNLLSISHEVSFTSPVSTSGAPQTKTETVVTQHETVSPITVVGGINTIAVSEYSTGSDNVVNLAAGKVYRNNVALTAPADTVFKQVETSSSGNSSSSTVYAVDSTGAFWYAENNSTTLSKNSTITEPIKAITTGYYGSVFLLTDSGKVYAAGRYNAFYDLGTGTGALAPSSPALLNFGGSKIKLISGAAYSGHAVDEENRIWGWGYGPYGRVGDNTTTNRPTPVLISQPALNAGESIIQIDGANANTAILTSQGRVFEWGISNGTSSGSQKNAPSLVTLAFPETPVFIARGATFQSYVISETGKLYGWSSALSSDPLIVSSPGTLRTLSSLNAMLLPGEKFVDVSFGRSYNDIGAALTSTGRLITWGNAGTPLSPTPTVYKTGVTVPAR